MGYDKYYYNGPVEDANTRKCLIRNWYAETHAVSKEKARNNFMHQYRDEFGLERNVRIKLPGEIKMSMRKD